MVFDNIDTVFVPSRRTVLKAGAAGGLLLVVPMSLSRGLAQTSAAFSPDAFIRIDTAGKTTIIMPQVEMGQGVYTAHAMVVAEELDADWQSVSVEAAPPDTKLYANPLLTVQATGNSNSVRAFWKPLRRTAAAAKPRSSSRAPRSHPGGAKSESGAHGRRAASASQPQKARTAGSSARGSGT